ncbi:hypothetical protein V6N11_065218 [Hibiscus sabdariffa]|uniref:Uncharacterized protein n=1 Tax=Hibiscus sabdariffa TaxID=183260 RepID=A0ABR2QGW5_9ROSI
MISIFFQTPLDQERVKPRPKILAELNISFILDSQYFLHSSSGEKFVERKIYSFDIGRVKLKKRMNAVQVRDQKHELTLSRNSGNEEVTAFPLRDIVYKQDKQLQDLGISQ